MKNKTLNFSKVALKPFTEPVTEMKKRIYFIQIMVIFVEIPGPCDRNPCYNRGKCYPGDNGGYRCFCQEGYTGDRCESGKICVTVW